MVIDFNPNKSKPHTTINGLLNKQMEGKDRFFLTRNGKYMAEGNADSN